MLEESLRKRSSDTPSVASSGAISMSREEQGGVRKDVAVSSLSSSPTVRKRRHVRVKIKRFHGVARWTWNAGDEEVCGICQEAFEGVAPGVKYPGDECPVVWGKCSHAYHLQCVSTWLSTRSTCPICRAEWEFGAEKQVDGEDTKTDN
mmetsp:Transcript_502/g.856  ORF Transcript_502/g.856 Transcript_502/m.856 type:complete len:148 (-) Transcript_502:3713-4156(-)